MPDTITIDLADGTEVVWINVARDSMDRLMELIEAEIGKPDSLRC